MPYTHLTIDNRESIQNMINSMYPITAIAEKIRVHRSTIYRELKRNLCQGKYISYKADFLSRERRYHTKTRPKKSNRVLLTYLSEKLKHFWSPEQISGRLALEHPKDSTLRISQETIYQLVWDEKAAGGSHYHYLRFSHKKKKKRYGSKEKRGQIPGRTFIDRRPSIVDKKKRIGDWEGDTIESAGKKAYIATFVERKTNYLIAGKMANKCSSTLNKTAVKAFSFIPKIYRKTLTVDSGKEFTDHGTLSSFTGLDIYFSHPYRSWERGANENMNGLLRQFFPKKKDFSQISQKQLDKVVELINNRPRKSLGYRTPRELFFDMPVALQT